MIYLHLFPFFLHEHIKPSLSFSAGILKALDNIHFNTRQYRVILHQLRNFPKMKIQIFQKNKPSRFFQNCFACANNTLFNIFTVTLRYDFDFDFECDLYKVRELFLSLRSVIVLNISGVQGTGSSTFIIAPSPKGMQSSPFIRRE